MDDAFEFTSQLQAGQVQDPQNPTRALLQVSKMNIAYRVDGMLFATRMSLTMQGTLIYWLDDLKETDAKVYKDFIQDALRMADGWHKERVKATTGLEITGQMPRVPAPGGLHPGR